MEVDAGLLAQIQANNDTLNACPRHYFDFDIEGGPAALFGKKATCQRCKGQMRLTDINQYVRGYEAHGGNGNDVVRNWKDTTEHEPRRKFFGQCNAD